MRRNADWMKQQDDRILEYLDREGWATPAHIAESPSVDVSEGQIEERLLMLGYAGLVWRLHGDMWELTTEGRMYLHGDLDAAHQPRPTVERVLRG